MSNKHETALRKLRASPIEKNVLNVLAGHADSNGFCFPGISTLAVETGLGETSIMLAISQLEGEGLLRVERRSGRGNRYFLSLEEIEFRVARHLPTKAYEERRQRAGAKRMRPNRTAPLPSGSGPRSNEPFNSLPAAVVRTSVADDGVIHYPPLGVRRWWNGMIAVHDATADDVRRWGEFAVEHYASDPESLNLALLLKMQKPQWPRLPYPNELDFVLGRTTAPASHPASSQSPA